MSGIPNEEHPGRHGWAGLGPFAEAVKETRAHTDTWDSTVLTTSLVTKVPLLSDFCPCWGLPPFTLG